MPPKMPFFLLHKPRYFSQNARFPHIFYLEIPENEYFQALSDQFSTFPNIF